MSKVRILLRWILLATAALVLITCTSRSTNTNPSPGGGTSLANPCGRGVGDENRDAPIICVDDTNATLSVHPDPITVHARGKSNHQPVMIHWWTRSGSNKLQLDIRDGCVTDVSCDGDHCSARTLPATTTSTRCKYDVWTDKHPKLDPDIVVDPCC